jgi:DNA-binding MarR family transcriptional regulator
MKLSWLTHISEYWKSEYPERDFSRMRPIMRLSRLALLMPVYQKHVLSPNKLAPTDYSILGALRRAGIPRQLKPEDLYNTLGCTPGGLTKMVDRLEKRGLVQRTTDREDGRRARIRLTPKGAEVERTAGKAYNDSVDRLMSQLSDEQVDQIDSALELLLSCFESSDDSVQASPFAAPQELRAAGRASLWGKP